LDSQADSVYIGPRYDLGGCEFDRDIQLLLISWQLWPSHEQTGGNKLLPACRPSIHHRVSVKAMVSRAKSEFLADAKATKYDSVDYDDVKVTTFGDTAIATGDFKAKGTDASGKPLVDQRFTDTWVKMPNGHWQCVASHQSPTKM
jgi:hypothetical protein